MRTSADFCPWYHRTRVVPAPFFVHGTMDLSGTVAPPWYHGTLDCQCSVAKSMARWYSGLPILRSKPLAPWYSRQHLSSGTPVRNMNLRASSSPEQKAPTQCVPAPSQYRMWLREVFYQELHHLTVDTQLILFLNRYPYTPSFQVSYSAPWFSSVDLALVMSLYSLALSGSLSVPIPLAYIYATHSAASTYPESAAFL